MAERITWQNVAAPDMRAAIYGQAVAGEQLAKGFSSLGSTFKGVNDQNITDESNAAIMEAMKIQDPAAWDKMMATSGIAGLGIGAGRANSDLLNFAAGYGDELAADRETNRAYGESVYAAGQERIQDQRAEALYQQGLAEEAMKQEAALAINGLAKDVGTNSSPEDLKRAAWNMGQDQFAGNLPMQAALMTAAGGVDPTAFAVSGDVLSRIQAEPAVVAFQNGITSEQNLYKMAEAPSPVAQAYIDGLVKLGSGGNAIDALLTDVTTKINETVPKDAENRGVYDETPGSVQDTFNTLKADFENVPDVIIANLMQQKLQSNGYIWSGPQVVVDTDNIRGILNGLNTPEQLSDLEDQRTKYDNDIKGFASRQAAVDKAIQKMALAESQNEPDAYKKAAADLEKLLTAGDVVTKEDDPLLSDADVAAAKAADAQQSGNGQVDGRRMQDALDRTAAAIDPRIAETSAEVKTGVSDFANYVAEEPAVGAADRIGGGIVGGLVGLGQVGLRGAAYATGLANPANGSDMLKTSDAMGVTAQNFADLGVVDGMRSWMNGGKLPDPTFEAQNARIAEPEKSSTWMEAAIADPGRTYERMATELGVKIGITETVAIKALRTGRRADGTIAKPEEIKRYKTVLKNTLKRKLKDKNYKADQNDANAKLFYGIDSWLNP